MWELLQEEDSLDAIVEAIESEYDVSREQVESDLASFLKGLRESGLVEQN